MKKLAPLTLCLLLAGLTQQSHAAYSENFDTATGTNFAPQLGWTINDPTSEVSFVVGVAAPYIQSVALGGFQSAPAMDTVSLSHSLSETLSGQTFKVDFAVINRDTGNPGDFFAGDDSFSISLTGAGGFVFELSIDPTLGGPTIDSKAISLTGNAAGGFIEASDYNTPAYYTMSVDFTAVGTALNYSARFFGSTTATLTGSLPGQATAVAGQISASFDVAAGDPADSGSNFMLIDNIDIAPTPVIPEAGASVLSLLSLGMLTLRRRRR
ncbi:MAG: hypothetical protein V4726_08180 [Verrucomicrobiota bacterium]